MNLSTPHALARARSLCAASALALALAGLLIPSLAGCDAPTNVDPVEDPQTLPDVVGDCVVGTLQCACSAQGACALDSDTGAPLTCVAGVCLLPACPPGDVGCACKDGDCDDGATCRNDFCIADDCAPGSLNCSCALGGSCDVGLFCQEGAICVDQTGFEGGACLANDTCHPGNRCDPTSDRCVFCDRGTEACACTSLGGCGSGLSCIAGTCLAANDLRPENPRCYTPCRGDLIDGADSRTCSTEHLMEGCIDDQVCNDGSCVDPGQLPPTCASDVDCPFFQACLQGGCYSNCESNADCPPGLGCAAHVCRAPCSLNSGSAACPNNTTCNSFDGETGFCSPIRRPEPVPQALPAGSAFTVVTEGTVELTNLRANALIRLQPRGSAAQQVTVTKLSHRLLLPDGTVETIDTPIDPVTGEPLPCSGNPVSCPLWWLELGNAPGQTTRTDAFEFFLPGGCGDDCPPIVVANATGSPGLRYEGRLLVSGPGGTHEVSVQYAETVDGRWTGDIHYFTNFGEEGLQDWIDSPNKADVSDVRNALIQRWGAFRRGNLEGVAELDAVLNATRTGAWEESAVQNLCDAVSGGSENAVCYPFSNPEGVRRYVQDVTVDPVPSATTEMPLALNLKTVAGDPTALVGRIDSTVALQYPNNPAISLQLSAAPSTPGACDPRIPSSCVVFLTGLRARIAMGGRYVSESPACRSGYRAKNMPWLVEGFTEGSRLVDGVPTRTECRDSQTPFTEPERLFENVDLAGANPVPDGQIRTRTIELLDGALIDQSRIFFLFRETFPTFVPGAAPVSAYGFISLRRSPVDLSAEDFVGITTPAPVKSPPSFGRTCDPDFLADLGLTNASASQRATTLIKGSSSSSSLGAPLSATAVGANVHYVCGGRFDAGGDLLPAETDPFNGGTPPPGSGFVRDRNGDLFIQVATACQLGEAVRFFYTDVTLSPVDLLEHPCNDTGSCSAALDGFIRAGQITDADPIWSCTDPNRLLCDDDLEDRRVGKSFFVRPPSTTGDNIQSLAVAVDEAFRYKTRFVSGLDDDLSVGFTPLPCIPGSDDRPYCFDAEQIEEARNRFDCLVDLYTNRRSELPADVLELVDATMRGSFAEQTGGIEGFERLFSELMVMLGDEELTSSFSSRFDLAGVDTENFEGSAFEDDGIDLSGVAGAEMSKLYRAVQYYDIVLDRFYAAGPHFGRALALGDTSAPANLISPQTVTLYLPKIVRAAAQKSFAWSEIAKRYRDFNRPDLATRVLSRAYAQTYLESVLISRMMLDISARSQGRFQDQIAIELLNVQRRLRVALLDMREVFQEVAQGTTFFGFPKEYVPFPAIDTSESVNGTNGFDVLLSSARSKMLTAKEREQIAFDSLLSTRLDSAQFQGELVRVRNQSEDQLATLCGTFIGDDGVEYPAIKKYAAESELAQLVGDPCALFGNGTIAEAMLSVDTAVASLDGIQTRYRNAQQDIVDEQRRVQQQCALVQANAEFEYQSGDEIRRLEDDLRDAQTGINIAVKALNVISGGIQQFGNCMTAVDSASKSICAGLALSGAGFGVVSAGLETGIEIRANDVQDQIAQKRLETARYLTESQCQAASIDAARTMAQMIRGLDEIVLEALRARIAVQIELAQVNRLQSEAARLQERQAETLQQLIDVEAARNDPNTRIFRNESIINADIAFDDAMRAAYRATRMYEYYTSTSYVDLEQLFLIRLAGRGVLNLENYLIDLENAFADFEEDLGLPDARVAIYSLRDDILQVPLLGNNGEALSQTDRIARMQEMLKDPNRLDKNGYITIPFSTGFEQLSPLTRNHKIRFLEVNVIGSNVGDRLGRIYLRQRGTSVLQSVDDSLQYFVFPARTAVVDVYYNGNRVFPNEVYRNLRLRDRPVAHTMWELVINQRDEEVNRDIDLSSVSDIQVMVFYTDFTVF